MKKTITFGKISSNLIKNASASECEPTSSGFGTFGKKASEKNTVAMKEIMPEDEEETERLEKVMGMTSFGRKAKTFDVQEMLENITKSVSANRKSEKNSQLDKKT